MNSTQAAFLGAATGGAFVLVGAVFTNFVALRNEHTRQEIAARAARIAVLREHAASAFAQLFKVQHAIEWVAWYSQHDPSAVDENMVKSYEDEIHRAYPELISAMAMVASVNLDAYEKMRPIVTHLYDLEGNIARILRQLKADPVAAAEMLRSYLDEARKLEETLPPELSRIIALAEANPRR